MTGKKFGLGLLIFLYLFVISSISSLIESRIAIFILWILTVVSGFFLNNYLCKKWFSFDKLKIYNYSWKQFGIIAIIFSLSANATGGQEPLRPGMFGGACAFYIFLGYLCFYLSDRYLRRRIYNVVLKLVPFLILVLLFFFPLISKRNSLLISDLKTIHYMDVLSSERFEISPGDIEIELSILSEFAKAQQDMRKYLSLIDELSAETIDDTMFIRQASQIETSFHSQIESIEQMSRSIKSTLLRGMIFNTTDLYKNWILGLGEMREGVEKKDLKTIQVGLKIIRECYSKRLQLFKNYASIVRVESGDRIEDQRSLGLIRVEIVRVITDLEEYEVALLSLKSGDLVVSEFEQLMYRYESSLKNSFQKCDSLMNNIRDPKVMGIFEKYLNYKNIYGSILYQSYQALSNSVQAYMHNDLAMYNINYEKYTNLSEKTDDIINDYLSIFLQE